MKVKGTWKDSLASVKTTQQETAAPPLLLRLARCLELRQAIDKASSLRAASTTNSYADELDEESEEDVTTSWLLQLRKEFDVEGFSDLFAADRECVALLLKALGCNGKPSNQTQSDPCGTSVTLFTTLFNQCSNAAKDQVLDQGIIDRLLLRLGDLQAEEPRKPQRSKKFQLALKKDSLSTNKDSSAPNSTSTSPAPISGSTPGPGVAMNPYAYFPSHALSASATTTTESTSTSGGGGSTNNPQVLTTEMRAKVLWRPGYGTGEASSQASKADAEREAARIEKVRRTTKVLNCLYAYLECLDESARWNEVLDCLDSSCLLRVFMSSFYGVTSKAVVENEEMYSALLRLVGAIAKKSQLISLLGDVPGVYKSVRDLIRALHELAMQDLADEDDEPSQRLYALIVETFTLTEAAAEHFPVPATTQASSQLAENSAPTEVGQSGEAVVDSTCADTGTAASAEMADLVIEKEQKEYEESMKPELFKDLDMRDPSTQKYTYHHYQSQIEEDAKDTAASKNRQRRLNRELKALRTTLPLHFGSTIVFRIDRTRPYVAQFIIFAPQNTPYDSGAFLFDLFCTADYPNEPPKVNLQTTGQGRVRFNPNLYQNGKVCLSLLGTWRGGATGLENWSAEHSSLYQVLVSIQSAILGSEFPYFNEPTVEALWGTEEGEIQKRIHANGGYERLRVATIQYAMTAQIKNPPVGFENCVRTHFLKKRRYIGEVCKKWLAEADVSPTLGHFQALKEAVRELDVALASLGPMEIQEIRKAGPDEDSTNKQDQKVDSATVGDSQMAESTKVKEAITEDQSKSTSSFEADSSKQQETKSSAQMEGKASASAVGEQKKDLVSGEQEKLTNQEDLDILKACFPNFPESILKDVLNTTSNLDQSINTLAEFASSNNVN